jgi:hypothetical protein
MPKKSTKKGTDWGGPRQASLGPPRHRDKSGRIERKHGNTKVAALRKEYGPSFAKGRRKDMMLKTLLEETGSASLHDYLRRHHKK